jgi:hypothetical protein
VQHRIQLHPAGRDLYRVSGAVDLYDTGTPIPDAARALIAAGASPSDTLQASGADCTFSPMTLGRLTMPRKPPRKSDLLAMARF